MARSDFVESLHDYSVTCRGEVIVIRHHVRRVQRPDGPDDGLALIGQDYKIQFMSSLQGTLEGDVGFHTLVK